MSDQHLIGTEADDFLFGAEGNDWLEGLGGHDTLIGSAGNDLLDGGNGDDHLDGGAGNDYLDGGAGADFLQGGAGNDTYYIDGSSGLDLIRESVPGANDVDSILFGEGIRPEDLLVTRQGQSLTVRIAETNAGAQFFWWYSTESERIEQLIFSDGTVLASQDIELLVNDRPILAMQLADQQTDQDQPWTYQISESVFIDTDPYDYLTYSASLDNGAPLPSWLNFEADTRTFSGIPNQADAGQLAVRVTASDRVGLFVSDVFALLVRGPNHAPIVVNPIPDQTVYEGFGLSYFMPPDTFLDIDLGDSLSYSAALADGSELPAWLAFDPLFFQFFSGAPEDADIGTTTVRVTATDLAGASAYVDFNLIVLNSNDPPIIATPIADQTALEDLAFSFVIPAGAFYDADGDVLTYSLPIDAVLPEWLGFDATTGTFFGTPLNEDVGTISLSVEARDGSFFPATATFSLTVLNTNDAPYVYAVNVPNIIQEGTPFWATALSSFLDPDLNDVLTYSAALEDGSPLPGWLTFDPATASFSGTPGPVDMGFSALKITATDIGGLSTFTFLEITVTPRPGVELVGTAGADTLTGKSGNDTLNGLGGADTMIGTYGDDIYYVENAKDLVTELSAQGNDTVFSSLSYTLPANVENLVLTGTAKINGTGNALNNRLTGNSNANTLTAGVGDDYLDGGAGADTMIGGAGNDSYVVDNSADKTTENANAGVDTVLSAITLTLGANLENLTLLGGTAISGKGNAADNVLLGNSAANALSGADGHDLLQGGAGADKLTGDGGTDVLQGQEGADALDDGAGNGVLDGGAGNDSLKGGSGRQLLIGGAGDDVLTTGSGADIIAFNSGDGRDVVTADAKSDNTLSLGSGLRYQDMTFSRSANNLVLKTGGSDQLTFKDWYAGSGNHSIDTLQFVTGAMPGGGPYNGDHKVETFDFAALADAFDAAGQVSGWALTNALLDAHLAGSDTEAIGGDLAYQYGANGTLSRITLSGAQQILNDPQFGSGPQTLHALDVLTEGPIRLA